MIRRFDLWVISKMEILAHWLQYWTCKNCFFWSKLAAIVTAAAVFVEIWQEPKINGILAVNILWIFNMLRVSFFGIGTGGGFDQRYLEHMAEGRFGNPVKYETHFLWMRCVMYCMMPLVIVAIPFRGINVYAVEAGACFLCYMFGSCDPMPPCKGRLFAARRLALALEGRNG